MFIEHLLCARLLGRFWGYRDKVDIIHISKEMENVWPVNTHYILLYPWQTLLIDNFSS